MCFGCHKFETEKLTAYIEQIDITVKEVEICRAEKREKEPKLQRIKGKKDSEKIAIKRKTVSCYDSMIACGKID